MRTIQSPVKYIQGPDVIFSVSCFIRPLANRWLVLMNQLMQDKALCFIRDATDDMYYHVVVFGGECSLSEIKRVVAETEMQD